MNTNNYAASVVVVYSYIKSWKTVPSNFIAMDGTSLNFGEIKGWLFRNLPEKHAHRYVHVHV